MIVERRLSAKTLFSQLFSTEIMQIQFFFSLTLTHQQDVILMDNYGYYCGRPASGILLLKKKPSAPWMQKSHIMNAIGDQINEILDGVMEQQQTRFYVKWLSDLLQKVIAPNSLDQILPLSNRSAAMQPVKRIPRSFC